MVLYSKYCKNRGIAKLGCSDHLITCAKGEKNLAQVEQIMDIERYFAAFPALERTVPSCLKKATDTYLSHTKPAASISPTIQSAVQLSSGSLKDDQLGRPINHPQQKPARKQGFNSSSPQANGVRHYKTQSKANSRKTSIPTQQNSRNFNKFQQHRKRKPKQVKILASKPWKHLADISSAESKISADHVSACSQKPGESKTSSAPSLFETNSDGTKWISLSSDELDAVLSAKNEEIPQPQFSSISESVSRIWSDISVDDSGLSHLSAMNDTTDSVTGIMKEPHSEFVWQPKQGSDSLSKSVVCSGDGDSQEHLTKSWHDDYKDIEHQMSQLLFCEDLDEEPSGSRMMRNLRDNSLSYMIRKGCLQSQLEVEAVSTQLKSCIHCEQSFEVVLELESSSSKPSYKSNLLNHIDPRLDFDWTKYHPPPWSNYSDHTDSKLDSSCRSVSCDCGYCRAQTWRKTCQWCATPL